MVTRLAADILGHSRMRQDQEPLVAYPVDDAFRNYLGWQDAVHVIAAKTAVHSLRVILDADHAGRNRLRANHGDMDTLVTVGNRQGLGECHGGMLGGRIRGIADLAEDFELDPSTVEAALRFAA